MSLNRLIKHLTCETAANCRGCDYISDPNYCSQDEYEFDEEIEKAIKVLKMIDRCDEKSATKCFECINLIKRDKYE